MNAPALALVCFLLTVPVQECDPRAQAYVDQAQQLPPSHLAMITSVALWDQENGEAGLRSKTIWLPSTNHWDPHVLAHETGHIVAATLGLNSLYADEFWSDGAAVGKTTAYGRSSPFEDLAECYAAITRYDAEACGADRVRWLGVHAFAGTLFEVSA